MELLTQKVIRLKEILPSVEGLSGILHLENWTEETTDIVFDKEEKTDEVPEETEAIIENPAEGTVEDTIRETIGEIKEENLENP